MKAKWYIGALVVILTVFGISQENLVVPNQEIVLQFSKTQVSQVDAEIAIDDVKKQLELIGVSKVNIRKDLNGSLIISYYSDTTVANLKELFDTEAQFYVSNNKENSFPSNQTYNLAISEIQKSSDSGFGSSGKLLFTPKQDYDRLSNHNFYVYLNAIDSTGKNTEITVAYKSNKTIAINNIPHKIPEGRAGPIS